VLIRKTRQASWEVQPSHSYYPQRRWVPHNSGQVMNVYVVMLEDPFAAHLIGVYATKEAAQRYVEMQDNSGEINDEYYIISELPVRN
jgi:hypothetical protein